jgi:hypothetical protein
LTFPLSEHLCSSGPGFPSGRDYERSAFRVQGFPPEHGAVGIAEADGEDVVFVEIHMAEEPAFARARGLVGVRAGPVEGDVGAEGAVSGYASRTATG